MKKKKKLNKTIISPSNKQTFGVLRGRRANSFALFADALLPLSLDKKERGDSPEPLESRRILSQMFNLKKKNS